MAPGRGPPRARALASTIGPGLFTEPERENGRAAWLLGACFISEGAIPFAAADPLRVIPSMMFGGAITGALIMAFEVTLRAPHGGIFVFFAIGNLLWFLVALAVRTIAGPLAVIVAEAVVSAGVPVTLSMDGGEPVDAGSALMIMTLGAGNGAEVTVASDDEDALKTVAELVRQDLDA